MHYIIISIEREYSLEKEQVLYCRSNIFKRIRMGSYE